MRVQTSSIDNTESFRLTRKYSKIARLESENDPFTAKCEEYKNEKWKGYDNSFNEWINMMS